MLSVESDSSCSNARLRRELLSLLPRILLTVGAGPSETKKYPMSVVSRRLSRTDSQSGPPRSCFFSGDRNRYIVLLHNYPPSEVICIPRCELCGNAGDDLSLLSASHKDLGTIMVCRDCWEKLYEGNLILCGLTGSGGTCPTCG